MAKKYSVHEDNGINSQFKIKNDVLGATSQDNAWADRSTGRRETAAYIQRMTTELCTMANKADFSLLVYLLDMARIEAHDRVDEELAKAGRD